jgi:hypothetical protein
VAKGDYKMKIIKTFTDDYEFLSNFYESPLLFNNMVWQTVEHPFQAYKSTNKEDINIVYTLKTPGEAKKFGRAVKLRPDWEEIKLRLMTQLLFAKFASNWALSDKLLKTNPAYIEEGNYWHDNFWGNCYCQKCSNISGQNHLGRLLMMVRSSV